MLLVDLAATSSRVAATSSRKAKVAELAACLGLANETDPETVEVAAGLLIGQPRQGRVGVGWATIAGNDAPAAADPTLTVLDVDVLFDSIAATTGPGSQRARADLLDTTMRRATAPEQELLGRIFLGDPSQGALEGVLITSIAAAASVTVALVRRATMLSGDVAVTARIALTEGAEGLRRVGLTVMRPVKPMLASTAESTAAMASTKRNNADDAADTDGAAPRWSVEWKLDGARIQVHRDGNDVSIFTRNLNDVTDRMPSVVDLVRSLPVRQVILDGESLGMDGDGAPQAFQDTMSSFGSEGSATGLQPHFFDVLHVDGRDLIDEPLTVRRSELERIVPTEALIPASATSNPADAEAVLRDALDRGHEGIMLKALDTTYDAGRRGKGWLKIKPVYTLDLVVLAVEWGHGRRQGWLSNLHLGARDDRPRQDGQPDHDSSGEPSFVMLGKTFKGLTDELLAWQTERFLGLETHRDGHIVHVRPEQVVEIAVDGIQTSSRYPGKVALRFARVKRYRDDKPAAEADTLSTVRAL